MNMSERLLRKYAGVILHKINEKVVACESSRGILVCCSYCNYKECPVRDI